MEPLSKNRASSPHARARNRDAEIGFPIVYRAKTASGAPCFPEFLKMF